MATSTAVERLEPGDRVLIPRSASEGGREPATVAGTDGGLVFGDTDSGVRFTLGADFVESLGYRDELWRPAA